MIHFPIAFLRTHRGCLEDGPVRKLIMKLCRFVNGTWKYPEMNTALGFGSDAHIFELVVPICEMKSIFPDTNLAAVHAMSRSFSEEEPEPVECLVEKIAPECFIPEDEREHKDNPKDSTLNVEVAKPETDGSVVWVFDLVDPSHPFDENEEDPEAKVMDPVTEGFRIQQMFQPLLTWDFWLLYEAITGQSTVDGTYLSEKDADEEGGYGYEGKADMTVTTVASTVVTMVATTLMMGLVMTYGAAYNALYNAGLDDGHESGSDGGSDEACNNEYDVGYEEGEDAGYKEGRKEKYNIENDKEGNEGGTDEGNGEDYEVEDSAYEKGYDEGYGKGYDKGHDKGHEDSMSLETDAKARRDLAIDTHS
ncbi:hypothetical protein N8T08_004870 [Aspergillus melleus]|uniref:Uncharacterized protein n=1 Tax=Aspergillus melleus TaxID=138277 RepID=A0ACC3B3W0_9EURO|nr:hypothetical protein N8T08_004870 [Aspergillus melleus]